MDCGPASLKCFLDGFGIGVSYGRLREACQTEVDGTSIDTIEEVAVQLGVNAEQILIPADHLRVQLLPAIVVVKLPNGANHFVVAWRHHGRFLQIMDPRSGRQFRRIGGFINELYIHTMPIFETSWLKFATSDDFLTALAHRQTAIGLAPAVQDALTRDAVEDPSWHSMGALDAATRMVTSLVTSRAVGKGTEASRVLEQLYQRARVEQGSIPEAVPAAYWSVRQAEPAVEGEPQLLVHGAVVVHALGRDQPFVAGDAASTRQLSPELVAALNEAPSSPGRSLWRMMREDGLLAPAALSMALFVTACGILFEALSLRGILEVVTELAAAHHRAVAAAGLLTLFLALFLLALPVKAGLMRLGRGLEARLRVAFLKKIPRLGDRYFQSRLTSDMAERSHAIHGIRRFPLLAGELIGACFGLALTTAGIIYLDPRIAPLVLLAALLSVAFPLLAMPLLSEQDLRFRSHTGALSRFYLDGLLGLVAIRSHGAGAAVRGAHEQMLIKWTRAGLDLQRTTIIVEGLETCVGFGLAALILFSHIASSGAAGGTLLLLYWALGLPAIGSQIAGLLKQYPHHRSLAMRLLEPLGAPEAPEHVGARDASGTDSEGNSNSGVPISLEKITVCVAGHKVLREFDLTVDAGEHLAIVGPSGAGKSTFIGLLLGWHKPVVGRVRVNGALLAGDELTRLRDATAWLDPAVQLWNNSLFENLVYGTNSETARPARDILQRADLMQLLHRLPDGLQTQLGENGGLISGGEAQRVRLGRAMMKRGIRLALLDEPFRGLDRDKRRELLKRARALWSGCTLLCATHDVSQTLDFPRVLVVESGRLVEDGDPADLAQVETSRYRSLLDAEHAVRSTLWRGAHWRRFLLAEGQISERHEE